MKFEEIKSLPNKELVERYREERKLLQKMKFQNSSNSKTFRSAGTTQNNPTAPANITGLHITTNDAQTLTDGPTIYLANNIENIGRYYIHKTNVDLFNAYEYLSSMRPGIIYNIGFRKQLITWYKSRNQSL